MPLPDSAANAFGRLVLSSNRRLGIPIATYPGLALTGTTLEDVVNNPQAQIEIQSALHERYQTLFVMSAMDLSAEAEAFGAEVHLSSTEIPRVTGRLITNLEQARNLPVPAAGTKRTSVYIETVRGLRGIAGGLCIVGGCIGPFSLAARLVGVTEALELTMTEPELVHLLLEKATRFLTSYAQAFKSAGANLLLMAEPAAGLLSPKSVVTFSSTYVRQIAGAVTDEKFSIILHNCAAKLVHLPAILESGLKVFHFGAPMDLVAALAQVPNDVVLCGNLDPSAVFCQLSPAKIAARAAALLQSTAGYKNFVISSGCDLPLDTPLASLDAFYEALE